MGGNAATSQANLQALAQAIEPAHICPWQTLDPAWQERIQRAVSPIVPVLGVVYPTTAAELAAIMCCAQAHQWQVLPCGSGSKLDWGGLVAPAMQHPHDTPPLLLVSTARMNRLIDHATGDLTVTVEAGMGFAELQTILARANQFLALDPAYPDQATIGGIVATADTGSLRQRYNSVRDMLLGITLVRADGEIVKAGGRVVKNVAGYDLMKLFTGAYGTLGIITELTFRVYPQPEASQTVVLAGEPGAIAQATTTLLTAALTPTSVDVLSAQMLQALDLPAAAMGLAVRFQSIPASVQQQVNRTVELGQALGLVPLTVPELDDALWQTLGKRMTGASENLPITCKIGVRPSAAATVLDKIASMLPANTQWYGQIHAASGLGRLAFADPDLPPTLLLPVRSLCQANSGFLSILKAPVALKQQMDVWGYVGNALPLMRRIKQQFDPDSRLRPL